MADSQLHISSDEALVCDLTEQSPVSSETIHRWSASSKPYGFVELLPARAAPSLDGSCTGGSAAQAAQQHMRPGSDRRYVRLDRLKKVRCSYVHSS